MGGVGPNIHTIFLPFGVPPDTPTCHLRVPPEIQEREVLIILRVPPEIQEMQGLHLSWIYALRLPAYFVRVRLSALPSPPFPRE